MVPEGIISTKSRLQGVCCEDQQRWKEHIEGTDLKPLLKVEQAAEILNVNYGTMRTWVSKGHIPVVKLGKKLVRIRQEDLETYILKHRKGGADVH